MPMYNYHFTDEQGGEFEEFQHISENALIVKDGRPCERGVNAAVPMTRFGKGNGCDPIEMMSIALDTEEEIQEFRARNPGVEISDNREDRAFGVPIAKSRAEKLRILEKEGFVETN
jgi:hypothetical protein